MKHLIVLFFLFLLGVNTAMAVPFIEPVSTVSILDHCGLGGTCAGGGNGQQHVAVDYMATPSSNNTSTVARSVNYVKLIRNISYGSNSHNMGNVVIIEHLLNDGTKWLSLYAHLASKNLDNIEINKDYIVQKQNIGVIGCSGRYLESWCNPAGYNRHLHLELKKPGLGYEDLWPFGYMDQSEASQKNFSSVSGAIQHLFSSVSNFQNSNKEVALPYLSRTSNRPSISNYDVYGIVNETIYGYLNVTGRFHRSSIAVRPSFSRRNAGDRGGL